MNVKVLLDTHTILWALEDDPRLGVNAKKIIEGSKGLDLGISDMSLLEISMLVSKKRIHLNTTCASYLKSVANTVSILPINAIIAALAMKLDLPQSDPFDRVIAATADYYDVPLLTRDQLITESRTVQTFW